MNIIYLLFILLCSFHNSFSNYLPHDFKDAETIVETYTRKYLKESPHGNGTGFILSMYSFTEELKKKPQNLQSLQEVYRAGIMILGGLIPFFQISEDTYATNEEENIYDKLIINNSIFNTSESPARIEQDLEESLKFHSTPRRIDHLKSMTVKRVYTNLIVENARKTKHINASLSFGDAKYKFVKIKTRFNNFFDREEDYQNVYLRNISEFFYKEGVKTFFELYGQTLNDNDLVSSVSFRQTFRSSSSTSSSSYSISSSSSSRTNFFINF